MTQVAPFGSLYAHGFVRVAAAVPRVQVADPRINAERTLALVRQAADDRRESRGSAR